MRIGVLGPLEGGRYGIDSAVVDAYAHDVAVHWLERDADVGERRSGLLGAVARTSPLAVRGEGDVGGVVCLV